MSLVDTAKQFTQAAHESIQQKRKYTNDAYHVHPERVAKLVAMVTDDEAVISAAWLHDVLEDVAPFNSQFNVDAIKKTFGQRVLSLVLEVTDVSRPEDGNRAARKAIDRVHLSQASASGQTIKLADLIDNLLDIQKNDPDFFKVFRREALQLLPFLHKGNQRLFETLENLLGA